MSCTWIMALKLYTSQFFNAAILLFCLYITACAPVESLQSHSSRHSAPALALRKGVSLAVQHVSLSKPGARTPLEIVADGMRLPLDSVSSFRLGNGRQFIVIGDQPFLHAAAGRIDVYSRYMFRANDSMIEGDIKRLSPFDFLQKLPDDRLLHATSGSLLKLTADDPDAQALAARYRYHQRRANVTLAAGATLAAAGAITAFIGAFTSDADRDYRRPYYVLGGAGFAVGAGLLTIPLPYFASRAAHNRNAAINRYNGE